jgi:hypothetical protein
MSGIRGMAIGAALTFGVVLWWALGTGPAAEKSAPSGDAPVVKAVAVVARAASDMAGNTARDAASGNDDSSPVMRADTAAEDSQAASDAGFEQYVSDKYRFLLEAPGRSSRGPETLRAALQERERLLVGINTARQGNDEEERASLPARDAQLAALDQRISRMLPAADIAVFEVLKDSHIEQFQLDEYAKGISNVAPLQDAQHRAILFSKLAYRQRFRETLNQSGLMSGELPAAQRQAALGAVSRALQESRDSFLQEARQHLSDEEQFTLLANYENSEYVAELEKLRRIASGS